MKKALIQVLVIPLLTVIGVVLNALFPPHYVVGQYPPSKHAEDSLMSIEEAKRIIQQAEENARIVEQMTTPKNIKKNGNKEHKQHQRDTI